jgi:hypothetical protein
VIDNIIDILVFYEAVITYWIRKCQIYLNITINSEHLNTGQDAGMTCGGTVLKFA